jgi:hypothetical protein
MAQASFAVYYFILRGTNKVIYDVVRIFLFYLSQALVVVLVIGPFFLATYRRRAEEYQVGSPTDPLTILTELVIKQHFQFITTGMGIILAFALIAYLTREVIPNLRRTSHVAWHSDFIIYLLFWLILPCILAYLVFFVTGFEKIKWRYIIFCLPPVPILLAIAIEELVTLTARAVSGIGSPVKSGHVNNLAAAALMATIALTIPGAYAITADEKGLFRDISRSIVNLVESDPDSNYVIYEAGYRRTAMMDHYLCRFSSRVRAADTIRTFDEKHAQSKMVSLESAMKQNDYLVIAFPHRKETEYPQLLKFLSEAYEVHLRQMDSKGRGYLVFGKRQSDIVKYGSHTSR